MGDTARIGWLALLVGFLLLASWQVAHADHRHCDPYAASSITAAMDAQGRVIASPPVTTRGCR